MSEAWAKGLQGISAPNSTEHFWCFPVLLRVDLWPTAPVLVRPVCEDAQEDQNGSATVSSAKQQSLILIPTDFWTCQLLGIFTHDESSYCDKCVMPLGEVESLVKLPQACFPLVRNKRIRILYTFLEILLNPNLPRCCHLNADCRTSSEVH